MRTGSAGLAYAKENGFDHMGNELLVAINRIRSRTGYTIPVFFLPQARIWPQPIALTSVEGACRKFAFGGGLRLVDATIMALQKPQPKGPRSSSVLIIIPHSCARYLGRREHHMHGLGRGYLPPRSSAWFRP
jgi:hypothetical protein